MTRTPALLPADASGHAAAIDMLTRGGIVGIPTDTVYGICCSLDAAGGVERLFAAKGRPPDRAIIVLADGLDQLASSVIVTPPARTLERFWPGGLTLVLPLLPGATLPPALTAGTETLGVRVPDHPTPRALARAVGPIPTTSANRSGEPDALDPREVIDALGAALDLVLDGGRSSEAVPSTVIDCAAARPTVLREGAIPVGALADALDAAGLGHELRSGRRN
jgi:L-threonylcarbamoyladenylate synthase